MVVLLPFVFFSKKLLTIIDNTYYNKACQWKLCRCGETGRRTGLKILRDLNSRAGSIPAICTINLSMPKHMIGLFFI